MRDVIISDYACSDAVCVKLRNQLWPKDPPLVMTIPATGMSEAHRSWVENFRQSHGGKFLKPFIAQKMNWSDVRSISLIGFSAGCWGVREILADSDDAALVSFVYACDGLHGTYSNGRVSIQEPWLRYASRAASGDAVMVVSFSSIQPPGYPGTRESAIELGRQVGAAWLSPAPGGFANCLPSCDADDSVSVQEFGQAGNVLLIGSWPPGTSGTNAAAHVYQANTVQAAVWRTYLAPWLQNQPIPGISRGSKRKLSSLLVLGVGLVAFGASIWSMKNDKLGGQTVVGAPRGNPTYNRNCPNCGERIDLKSKWVALFDDELFCNVECAKGYRYANEEEGRPIFNFRAANENPTRPKPTRNISNQR